MAKKLSHDAAMARLESEADIPELCEIVAFLQGSKRGICGMKAGTEEDASE